MNGNNLIITSKVSMRLDYMKSRNKFALCIEYDGSKYYGWQRQAKVPSIQACLEYALSKIANHSVTTYCAGRTDAGVHSIGQIVHFETSTWRQVEAWTRGVNTNLPNDIAVRWINIVPDDFHARFSALARRYFYVIYNHRLKPALLNRRVMHYHLPLDDQRMQRAGQYLLGENDYSSFRSGKCQSKNPWRNIIHLNVARIDDYIIVDIKANAFLSHMVRNIVGCLIQVGCGNQQEHWIAELLTVKNRQMAASQAKAQGLYLVSIDYPVDFSLPKIQLGGWFLFPRTNQVASN